MRRGISTSSTEADIAWLPGERHIPAETFGSKASNLTISSEIRQYVPVGFALSRGLVNRIAKGTLTGADSVALSTFYGELSAQIRGHATIVRSSSSMENAQLHSFSGLFETIHDSKSVQDVELAIHHIYSSTLSNKVELYSQIRRLSLPSDHLAILVQEEVVLKSSALVSIGQHDALFEIYDGGLIGKIQGSGSPDHVVSYQDGAKKVVRAHSGLSYRFVSQLETLSKRVRPLLKLQGNKGHAVLEVGTDDERLFVLQLDFLSGGEQLATPSGDSSLDLRGTAIFSAAEEFGLKAAAMHYFRDKSLFQLPVEIFPPNTSPSEVDAVIRLSLPATGGFTVRFSHERDLSLPRGFLERRSEIPNWITVNGRAEWSSIVHPYIDVTNSFELLLGESSALIEHVPGMWESDSALDPDVVLIEKDKVTSWRSTEIREARYAAAGRPWTTSLIQPVTRVGELQEWVDRVLPILCRLREDFRPALPLNFHFVQDASGAWCFLNIRRGFAFNARTMARKKPHIVRQPSDLESWDGQAPIRLQFLSSRGDEGKILEIAESLPKDSLFPILIDFGLLSHPAMILRELGYQLLPTYLYDDGNAMTGKYERLAWDMDVGDEAIERILREPVVIPNSRVWVVADRDPIVPGHLLAISNDWAPSFADISGISDSIEALVSPDHGHIWIERGRAHFCTSGFTDSHAHGHLLPVREISAPALQSFVQLVEARKLDSLTTALDQAARASGEYMLIMTPDGSIFLRTGADQGTFPKRLIRQHFQRL